MRVADAVRATSVVQRLKEGEKFTDAEGNWVVSRPVEDQGDTVTVYVKPVGKPKARSRGYKYPRSAQVKMLRP